MSSRKVSGGDITPRRRRGTPRRPAKQPPVKSTTSGAAHDTTMASLDRDADRFAASLEAALAEGHVDALAPAAVQRLMAAVCRAYRAQIDAGQDYLPLVGRAALAPTDVMITCGALLRAADLGVFELGIWQSFTGR